MAIKKLNKDEVLMARAIALAHRGSWTVSPNPMVGAVIVKGERVLAEGYHRAYGKAHAEVMAIKNAKEPLVDTSLYVNLEPCCHYGKTPPCTDAIIKSGIKEVVAATLDPNPLVAGEGIKRLQEAGIKTTIGVLEKEARALNERFFKFTETGVPFVTLKIAQSLDGKIATASGDSRWITSLPARRYAHRLRSACDALLVGIGTIRTDDPQLTCRLVKGRNPLRIVLDSQLSIPSQAMVLQEQEAAKTIIFASTSVSSKNIETLRTLGVEVVLTPDEQGKVNIREMLRELGARGITSLLVEGGGKIAATFLQEGLVDRVLLFVAPKIIGSEGIGAVAALGVKKIGDCPHFEWLGQRRLGEDILLEGTFTKQMSGCLKDNGDDQRPSYSAFKK